MLVLYTCATHARLGYIMALIHFQPVAFARCSMSSKQSVFYVCSCRGDIRHKTHARTHTHTHKIILAYPQDYEQSI